METVFVLTVVFLISRDPPLHGSASDVAATYAGCQKLKAERVKLLREHKFKVLSAACEKRKVHAIDGRFEIEPGQWESLPKS